MEASPLQDFLGRIAAANSDILIGVGRLESRLKARQLTEMSVERPVYITGLARSGTTIILELFSDHPEVVTHSYKDFPLVFTPLIWNWFLERVKKPQEAAIERSHKDGIEITSDSPEAMEEMLWMAFFEACHNCKKSSVLDANTSNASFEEFYNEHIKKMLWLHGGTRYVAKNNYNVSRLAYLLKLYPQARFIIPVRGPVWQIASSIKQHRLLVKLHEEDSRTLEYMRRSGHFEFGLDRRPINMSNNPGTEEVLALWNAKDEVRGWARYWALVHGFIANQLENDPVLARHTLIINYERLCNSPLEMLEKLYQHAELEPDDALLNRQARRLKSPEYYKPDFSEDDIEIVEQETSFAAERILSFAS